ncbi:unnamed protein product [Litomosoides sigmodontis]|uniref:CCDC66 domain-containing protein n=1 Tax=Litomosoides sigmodontis TaxID=42156 RepID=A0A3P6SEI6_LITSI|nr:unnamed protein product [Litomosoides sigmodontis]
MVRTYTWNPSTQSNLKIIGNFNNEDEKTVTNLLPTEQTNLLYSAQRFSNNPIYTLNYKDSEVPNTSANASSNDGTQNDDATSTVSSADNTHTQCPMHTSHSHATSLQQPHDQPHPICYPTLHDFPTNSCHWRSHLFFPSQLAAPVVPEQTTNLKPIDLWYLRPVKIGNKIYYEPVSSSAALYSTPASIVSHTVTPVNLISIPNNAQPQNGNLSYLPSATITPVLVDDINGQNKCLHFETAGINHSINSRFGHFNTNGSSDLSSTTSGTPQPNSEVCGTPWQTSLSATSLNRETNKISTASVYKNSQCHASCSYQLNGSPCQHSLSHTTTPAVQDQCCWKVTAIDSAEQYKRDLQLQIEQNRHRREEERKRELEIERKEMIKFEEYRRKVQQEIEEEERKEKEKILEAQRRAARMRAVQDEVALKVRREAENRTGLNVCCGGEDTSLLLSEDTRTMEEQTSSTAQPNHVGRWEKKKEHVNGSNTQRSVHSPVIPTLRKKNGISSDLTRNTAFEIPANNASASSCVPYGPNNKWHSSSRLSRRCCHSSPTSRRNNSLDSVRLHRKSSHTYHEDQSSLSSLRKNNESELKHETRSSHAL